MTQLLVGDIHNRTREKIRTDKSAIINDLHDVDHPVSMTLSKQITKARAVMRRAERIWQRKYESRSHCNIDDGRRNLVDILRGGQWKGQRWDRHWRNWPRLLWGGKSSGGASCHKVIIFIFSFKPSVWPSSPSQVCVWQWSWPSTGKVRQARRGNGNSTPSPHFPFFTF